jgi:predicted amidohydrolase
VTFTAAVVLAAPVAFDLGASVAKAETLLGEAAGAGADLVVFPEAFLSAYPRGITFGTTIGARTEEGRRWFRRYRLSSVDVPGPAVERLASAARRHGVHLVIGVIEREGGTLPRFNRWSQHRCSLAG